MNHLFEGEDGVARQRAEPPQPAGDGPGPHRPPTAKRRTVLATEPSGPVTSIFRS